MCVADSIDQGWKHLFTVAIMVCCAPQVRNAGAHWSSKDGRMSPVRHRTTGTTRVVATALVAALVLVTPAFAEPMDTSEPTTQTPDAPAAPAPSEPTSATDAPALPSVEQTESAVDVEVDEETKRFREELARKQAIIDEFMDQLDELDRQLAIAVESYNASIEELEYTRGMLSATEEDLRKAREAYAEQSDLLGERVRLMYLAGELSPLELLLDSRSLKDLVGRFVFLTTMSKADGELVTQLANERTGIEKDMLDIESAELQATALEFELKAQQIEIMLRIEERQQMMADAQGELLELLDEEFERRRLEQAELLEAIKSGAGDIGITIAEGAPVETAFAYHGIPYLWGGETPAGFDCSGLVLYVFKQHGVDLPHYSGSQFLLGTRVAPADLKPGDVVFFGSPIHHVGIYVGAGYFIHAPRTGDFVKVSPLAERSDYAGARRYPWQPRLEAPLGSDTAPTGQEATE
jgi:peptidoglycan hydrolase CwlO-like protein